MAGAIDLMLYGIAIFISPVAVYFKKGVGAQFWVNCCLYCLMGVPGIIHAFYIIHTTKNQKNTQQRSPQTYPQTAQQRSASLPSLPHSSRYRPQADFAPYEDHPPPIPPKAEDTSLQYDQSLHPNSANRPIARAKSVLHTYQIPESTLHPPPPRRSRRSTPSPNLHGQGPEPEPEPEPQPQPQPVSETRASSSTLHPEPNPSLPYPADYHPNSAGENIARAKAVLHTYQIPETTFPPHIQDTPVADEAPKQTKSIGSTKGSMWPLRSKGKGLSHLDINSPATTPKPDSGGHKSKWATSGPSWLRRRRGREDLQNGGSGADNEGPDTMTMVWDDNFETLRPRDRSLKQAKTHARTESEPISLSFPAPPAAIRPAIDRTGTSNTALLRSHVRRDSGLEPVAEDAPMPENTASEGEEAGNKKSRFQDEWRAETDTELSRSKKRLISRFGRPHRPHLDTVMDTTSSPAPPPSSASGPTRTESPRSPHLPRHIAPPSVLASSVDEPRTGRFRHRRTSSDTAGANPNSSPRSNEPMQNDLDFAMGEYGLGRSGDAYSAAAWALHSKDRSTTTSSPRGLVSPINGSKRLSVGTALSQTPTAASASTPVMRREWTQGTFGTGITSETSEGGDTRATSQHSKSESVVPQHQGSEERSQDEEIEEWIKREDERRQTSATNSQGHTPSGASEPSPHGVTPDTESVFSAESSGFAGIGVGTAREKGRGGNMELWDQPSWDGSNPSAGHATGSYEYGSSNQHGYPYANTVNTHENPFNDPAPVAAPSIISHSSYATGQESFPPVSAPISPPVSPNRPIRPTRAPPAIPGTEKKQTKPIPLRMPTFGVSGPEGQAGPSVSAEHSSKVAAQALPATPPVSPPRLLHASSGSSKPPPVPARPGSMSARAQSPKLPPKPATLRSISGEDDDMSDIYARALRDEI
ncbi:unnamed protein product [Rhizoctonia solani]|uniref:Uncharacterized protein n=1 Tax=Rhizoctonia solani TaxID=456999 RepID=A0A8H2WFI2_9AGAM|nr:unnamed protein product [Rhizoctonia solani]